MIFLLLLAIHLLAAVFWVGGLIFAYTVLRPASGVLDTAARLPLWRGVFARFLPWVGVSILVLLISGFWMIFLLYAGPRFAPPYVNIMMAIGIVMMLLYGHVMFVPWKRMRAALDRGSLPDAAASLNQIRMIVAINVLLGVVTIVVGGTGRFW